MAKKKGFGAMGYLSLELKLESPEYSWKATN